MTARAIMYSDNNFKSTLMYAPVCPNKALGPHAHFAACWDIQSSKNIKQYEIVQ